MSSGVILLQRPYISFSSPLLILRREITAATVALLYIKYLQTKPIPEVELLRYKIHYLNGLTVSLKSVSLKSHIVC